MMSTTQANSGFHSNSPDAMWHVAATSLSRVAQRAGDDDRAGVVGDVGELKGMGKVHSYLVTSSHGMRH
jgi:hypothetical protein